MENKDTTYEWFEYPREQEDKIIAALVSHNVPRAVSEINKVLDTNFLERRLSSEMSRCLLYCLRGTLLRAAEKTGQFDAKLLEDMWERENAGQELMGGCFSWDESMCSEEELFRCKLEEIRNKFEEIAWKIGQEYPEDEKNRNRHLCQEIMEYISQNYSDPNLNIAKTGEHFHMSPNYLSAIYRQETGKRLLEVIAQVRVREAEKLLMKGVSVVKAGEKVGFSDNTTFIRTFKKYTGMTPGQVKTENMI
ncbi:MAG: helix-turn-helix transcriptional regulator [Fusicatenibacter sp.]|nr:helix-turn-helix transcriptional regulator [Fusicatenibacter sp.]